MIIPPLEKLGTWRHGQRSRSADTLRSQWFFRHDPLVPDFLAEVELSHESKKRISNKICTHLNSEHPMDALRVKPQDSG
jgi:hypothetical protein